LLGAEILIGWAGWAPFNVPIRLAQAAPSGLRRFVKGSQVPSSQSASHHRDLPNPIRRADPITELLAKYLKHRDKTNEMRWLEIVEGVAGPLN
jgi:hypothetical protein